MVPGRSIFKIHVIICVYFPCLQNQTHTPDIPDLCSRDAFRRRRRRRKRKIILNIWHRIEERIYLYTNPIRSQHLKIIYTYFFLFFFSQRLILHIRLREREKERDVSTGEVEPVFTTIVTGRSQISPAYLSLSFWGSDMSTFAHTFFSLFFLSLFILFLFIPSIPFFYIISYMIYFT